MARGDQETTHLFRVCKLIFYLPRLSLQKAEHSFAVPAQLWQSRLPCLPEFLVNVILDSFHVVSAWASDFKSAFLVSGAAIVVQLQEGSGVVVSNLLNELGCCTLWAHQHFFLQSKLLSERISSALISFRTVFHASNCLLTSRSCSSPHVIIAN